MASHFGISKVAAATRTNTGITVPASAPTGAIAIVSLYVENDVAVTPAAGYAQLINIDHSAQPFDHYIFWKRLGAGEGGTTHTFNHASTWSDADMIVVQDVSATVDPVCGTAAQGTGTTATANSVTPTGNNAWIGFYVTAFANWTTGAGGPAGTTPTFTERDDDTQNCYAADGTLATAGATGTKSVTDASDDWTAVMVVVEDTATGAAATAAVTGTATASITEADVVAGGKTIVTTLTGDTFIADTVPSAAFASGTSGGALGLAGNGGITATLPATPTVGQFGLVIAYLDAGTATISAGWTLVTGAPWGSATPKLYIWTRVMLTGDTAPTVTIAGAGVSDSSCVVVALYNGIGSVVTIGTATSGTGTPSTAGQITGSAVGNIILGIIGRGDDENFSAETFGGSGTGVAERIDQVTTAGNDSAIMVVDKTLTATGATGNLSATTAVTDPYIGIIIELAVATLSPYKVAAVNHWVPLLDSAQAEANGWDARVKPALVAANFVRTSATVTTITLPAVASYDITAQETITDAVPAGILTGGAQIVATPTFTIDAQGRSPLNIERDRRSPRSVVRRRVRYT